MEAHHKPQRINSSQDKDSAFLQSLKSLPLEIIAQVYESTLEEETHHKSRLWANFVSMGGSPMNHAFYKYNQKPFHLLLYDDTSYNMIAEVLSTLATEARKAVWTDPQYSMQSKAIAKMSSVLQSIPQEDEEYSITSQVLRNHLIETRKTYLDLTKSDSHQRLKEMKLCMDGVGGKTEETLNRLSQSCRRILNSGVVGSITLRLGAGFFCDLGNLEDSNNHHEVYASAASSILLARPNLLEHKILHPLSRDGPRVNSLAKAMTQISQKTGQKLHTVHITCPWGFDPTSIFVPAEMVKLDVAAAPDSSRSIYDIIMKTHVPNWTIHHISWKYDVDNPQGTFKSMKSDFEWNTGWERLPSRVKSVRWFQLGGQEIQ